MCGKRDVDTDDIFEVLIDGSHTAFHLNVCEDCANKILTTIICQQTTTIAKNMADIESAIDKMSAEQTFRIVKAMMDASADREYQDTLEEMRKEVNKHATVHPPKERP
jgi:DNA-binding GntR family transcriptional regulator